MTTVLRVLNRLVCAGLGHRFYYLHGTGTQVGCLRCGDLW